MSHRLSASDFAGAHLGTPFFVYDADTTILDYENADAKDMLRYTKRRSQFFPVFAADRFLGVIKVRLGRDARLLAYFGPLDPQVIARLEELSQEANLQGGQRLSIFTTGIVAGDFYIVEDGSIVYAMAPASKRTVEWLGLGSIDVDSAALAPPDQFAGAIRKRLAEVRRSGAAQVAPKEPERRQ